MHAKGSLLAPGGGDAMSTTTERHVATGRAGLVAAKMLGLRLRESPGWLVPLLGGSVFGLLVLTWLTAALWFFTRSGVPLI
jgi:hypothetical protein